MKLTFLSIVGLCLTMMLQAQVSKTLEVAAGGLKTTLTPTELTTITNLTLTGTIDARDFKTMRDKMPLLAEINLSEVNVIAYQGDEGTSLWGNTDYLANTIPEYAFSNGSYQGKITLLNAVLPTSVTTVMEGAFNSCSELLSVTLPLGLKTIGYSSFHRCLGLTTINLPDGLTTIGDAAFHRCTNLTSITVPSTVTYIGGLSLGYSSYIEVDENNVNYSSNDGVLFNKTQTSLLQYYNSADDYYIIPSSVTMIGQYAFYLCENLNSVFIPSSVTAIGFESFAYCSGLESISIPSSVNLINHQAFNNCYNLNSIYSYPISAIDLNASVNVFNNVKKTTCILYVPFGSKTAYESANQWQDFENIVEMPGIFLSGNTVKMGENDGTASININSSADWTATSDQPWLTVNPSTGATGSDTITFTATANPGLYLRTATVTVSATGLDSQTIIVTQAALSILTVSSDSVVIGATANSTAMFKITSFPDWTATSNQPWLTLQPSSFVNTTIYAGTYSASGVRIHPTAGNIFFNNKEEVLTMLDDITIQKDFAGDYAVQTQIQLTQNTIVVEGKTMILVNVAVIGVTNGTGMLETDQNGNPTNYFDPSTRTYNLSYFYNTVAPRNIYEVLIGVATTSTITLTASANPASSIRQANVTISASGVQDKIVKVTQDASPVLAVSANSLVMAAAANSSITFNINSITNWTIASNQGWLTVSKTGGSNNDIIILTASANLATEARTAIITVIATGGITQTIYVKQFGIIPVSEKWNQFLTGNYNDISVVNDSVIWLSYSNTGENKISYTLNGGITWITKNLPSSFSNYTVGGCSAVSGTTAFIVCGSGEGLGVYKTTDGANTWTLQPTGFSVSEPTNFYGTSFPDFVYFWDSNNGVTYGDGDEIYTTNNGGAQWDRVSSPIMPIGIGEYMPNDQAFYKVVGNTIYIIVGAQPNSHSRILKSTDKGLTWYAIIPPTNTTSASFDFKDDNNGLYVDYTTQPSKLYSTTDGGQNWSLLNSTENLHYLKYIPNQNMYISTNGANGLLYSTNNGQTWITHPSFENVRTKNSVFSIRGTTYITGDGYVYSSKNIIGVNPSVDQATINSSTTLDLTFSNNVEIMSSNDTANYVLTYRTGNTIQRINTLSALRDNSNYALVHISTQTPLPFDTITIKVNNVYDMVGNPLINGSSSSTLTVILNLALSTSAMDIAAPANSTNTFSITSNLSWEIASDQTWLIPSSTSGSGNSTITLTATANNTGLTRSAIVTISATGVENQTIVVTQLGNDILGNSTVYSSTSTAANRRAIPVTFNENGEINSISVYHNGGSGNMLLGVYTDVAGKPAAKLGVTSSVAANAAEGWQTVALDNPVSVTSGQTVWLSFVFQNSVAVRYEAGTPGRAMSSQTWPAGMPDNFGTSGVSNYNFSVYCSYTPVEISEKPLGNTVVYSTTSTAANRRAIPVTFNENGEINSISVYHNGGSGSMLLGVYADVAGKPASRLGVTSSVAVNSAEGWQTVTLASPVSVSSGQKVWLSFVFQNSVAVRYEAGTPGRAMSSQTWSAGMPDEFGASGVSNYNFSLYCSYTPVEISEKPLGNNVVYNTTSTAANRRAIPVTFNENGEINSISVYHNGGTGNMLLGVYADIAGKPASRLGVTSSVAVNAAEGWQTVSLSNPVSVSSGQKVWLSFVFQNSVAVRYEAGTPGRAMSSQTWSAGMPDEFGTSGVSNYNFSVYCNYTPVEISEKPLGNTVVYNTNSTAPNRRAIPVTFNEDGTINSISVYHNGGTGNMLLGVYADVAGKPAAKLGVTSSVTVNAAEGWQTVSLASPVSVSSGQTVWLSFVFQNSVAVRYEAGTPGRAMSSQTWPAGMPDEFGTSGVSNYNFSVYCSYTPASSVLSKSGQYDNKVTETIENPIGEANELKVYPNPFSQKLNFEFVSARNANAILEIYNLNGQLIAKLLDQQVQGGVMNRIEYTPNEIISGMYIYKLNLDGNISVGKVIYRK